MLVAGLLNTVGAVDVAVRFWDGSEVAGGCERKFTLVVRDPAALRILASGSDVTALAEAYVLGLLNVEGDRDAAVAFCRRLCAQATGGDECPPRRAPGSEHTPAEDTRDVQAHYDLSNEFFQLFLDAKMVYSCAYFADPGESLERAQERKLDLVCRKLQLLSDEHFLDVGCGWGALPIWAAERYRVFAHGITLSKNQLAAARARASQAGLNHRVTVQLQHYAHLDSVAFNKISSVGIVEHVGVAKLPEYFASLRRVLRPGGLLLHHGIAVSRTVSARAGGAFILGRVFPGAELVEVSTMQRYMEEAGFEILDVQALRPHYEHTLREWARRFDARRENALELVGERVVRTWDLYLRGCADAFRTGDVGVYQVLATHAGADSPWPLPLLREDLGVGAPSTGLQ